MRLRSTHYNKADSARRSGAEQARGKMPRHGGKYLRIILFSLYLKKYTFFTPYQYRKVDALRNAREVVQCYVPIEALKTNGNANRKHNKKGRILTLLAIACTSRPYPKGIVNSTTQDILHHMPKGVLAAYPRYSISYICVIVKLIFDFLKHFYCL